MELISAAEAAARYPLSADHIRRLAPTGVVKAQRLGHRVWAEVFEATRRTYLVNTFAWWDDPSITSEPVDVSA